jgi:hypothetical protein
MPFKHLCEDVPKPNCPKCATPMHLTEAHKDKADLVISFFHVPDLRAALPDPRRPILSLRS